MDVGKKIQHEKVLNLILNKFGSLDVVINGAGINGSTSFLDITENEWNEIMDSQIKGTFFGCQVYGEYMVSKGRNIINISSASAGPPFQSFYIFCSKSSD